MSDADFAVIVNELKHLREDTSEIKQHVKITNGRVTKLESWRTFLIGAWSTLTIVCTAAAFVLGILWH